MDNFVYKSPFGILGQLVDVIVLKRYMTNLLIKRNETIKEFAESEKWKSVLDRGVSTAPGHQRTE